MSLLQLFHDPLDLAWGTQGFQIVTEKGTECECPCGDWGHAGGRQGTGIPGMLSMPLPYNHLHSYC